jgi:hypothetical protein
MGLQPAGSPPGDRPPAAGPGGPPPPPAPDVPGFDEADSFRRDIEPHRGVLILTFGILSIALNCLGGPLGVAAVLMAQTDLRKMRSGQMDPAGEGLTKAGRVCGYLGIVYFLLSLLYMAGFFTITLLAGMR